MDSQRKSIPLIGGIVLVVILVFGTLWVGRSTRVDTESAVRSVSLLYLDELAGRREQVVAENMQEKITVINTTLELMTEDDLSDLEHLQAYQADMKRLFVLEKFAFVDTDGLIYTSLGTQTDIDQYQFDYLTLSEPEISIKNLNSADKKVIIAVPVHVFFQGKELVVCFVDVDRETRKSMEQSQALQEALKAAESANKAKTAFLSNMSHEIRTLMNAIIALKVALRRGIPDHTASRRGDAIFQGRKRPLCVSMY